MNGTDVHLLLLTTKPINGVDIWFRLRKRREEMDSLGTNLYKHVQTCYEDVSIQSNQLPLERK